jgi:hypothetical protein
VEVGDGDGGEVERSSLYCGMSRAVDLACRFPIRLANGMLSHTVTRSRVIDDLRIQSGAHLTLQRVDETTL